MDESSGGCLSLGRVDPSSPIDVDRIGERFLTSKAAASWAGKGAATLWRGVLPMRGCGVVPRETDFGRDRRVVAGTVCGFHLV